ncbi:hypothetical protein [Comamonas sp. NLF-1-9]|uniref:hypothetical protein n=1 Tax=Comamonas sp. NLF-1-9 TaxID=2853163 RepID=UPI001C43E0AB|nr:hypothetical protein [Comamonas sp. NLF-1-9]QXL85706.1 hypothetical protein KUD94_07110 [Comamonas sp. NLF-1-9]
MLVIFPTVPEAITFGMDEDEALLQAADARETGLSLYVDARKPLSAPSDAQGRPTVRPSTLECAKPGVAAAASSHRSPGSFFCVPGPA